jgi:hypothetical protein
MFVRVHASRILPRACQIDPAKRRSVAETGTVVGFVPEAAVPHRRNWYTRPPRSSSRFPSRLGENFHGLLPQLRTKCQKFALLKRYPQRMTMDYRSTWDIYVSAWKATSVADKQAALEASAAPDCVYRDPLAATTGHDALVNYMRAFHQQVPGGHFEVTYFLAHHDRSIAKWNMRSGDGAILGEGVSYGEYGQDGRLLSMTGFFETPQA